MVIRLELICYEHAFEHPARSDSHTEQPTSSYYTLWCHELTHHHSRVWGKTLKTDKHTCISRMGPTVWTAAFLIQVYSSLWWGHTRTPVRTRSGHICVCAVSRLYFSRRNHCIARGLHHLSRPQCNVKLEFRWPLRLSKTHSTHWTENKAVLSAHTHTQKPSACSVGGVHYQQLNALSAQFIYMQESSIPHVAAPLERHTAHFGSLCVFERC